ncbi:helix-turn-helix domain-containing protein [Rathayibacter sp. AY1E1]|uniref:helix-turn-helix domain-containing protein n=1 Tax=Rathayibacter sp. AY1E1 TaxID=2080549 RepID=UPI0015E3006E|nr:helix-turn-helix transcriptional regulator [Rathayibacter sp. AY1E1]
MDAQPAYAHRIPQWTFGDKLRKARTTVGMDQKTFAERVNITPSSLAAYETGRSTPRFRDVHGLAASIELLTGIPRGWFLEFETLTAVAAAEETKARPSD